MGFDQKVELIGCDVLKNEPMSKHTSFKIGGPVDYFVKVKTKDELSLILNLIREYDVPLFIMGNGSNLLVSDRGVDGCVVKLDGDFNKINLISETTVSVGAAVLLSRLASFAMEKSLSGLEFASGIPGTIGGAVYMNAGAYGGQMSDIVQGCSHIDLDGNMGYRQKSDMNFGYRQSVYINTCDIITSVDLKLQFSDRNLIKSTMSNLSSKRKEKQPLSFPSAGSVFKRPEGYFAGTLVEQCGLKGAKVGGAMVSEKHAGFIVNTGNATSQDVCDLIQKIKDTVAAKTGIELQCEVKFIGREF